MIEHPGMLTAIASVFIGIPTLTGVNLPLLRQVIPAAQLSSGKLIELPLNFQEVPAPLQAFLSQGASNIVRSRFGENVGAVQNFFAFLDYKAFTMVLGFTVKLPDQAYKSKFDASLNQPGALKELTAAVGQSTSFLGPVSIREQKVIADLPAGIGNLATGMGIVANAGGRPLYVDAISFRRESIGALSLLGSLNNRSQAITIVEVARRLDNRLKQSQGIGNISSKE